MKSALPVRLGLWYAELDDCEVTVGRGTTTVRAELPGQGALLGLVQRITGLGLELADMHLVAPGR